MFLTNFENDLIDDGSGGTSTENTISTSNSSDLSKGAIAGIVVGSVAGVGAIGGLIGYLLWRKKKINTLDPF